MNTTAVPTPNPCRHADRRQHEHEMNHGDNGDVRRIVFQPFAPRQKRRASQRQQEFACCEQMADDPAHFRSVAPAVRTLMYSVVGMKLTFHGAAGGVTGSMHQLEADGKQYLLDCGMFQGRRKETERRNREFPFPAPSIAAVVLSHAHIDHSGRLPLLVKNGFHGPIYSTPATIDLCHSMLRDTAHIAESDADFVNRHHPDEEPVEPLYTMADADATMPLFRPVAYHAPTRIGGS